MDSSQKRNENQHTKILLLEPINSWEEYDDSAWRCLAKPVYRMPQSEWDIAVNHRERWIYLTPKSWGIIDPNTEDLPEWLHCYWDSQAGRWVAISGGGGSIENPLVHVKSPAGGCAASDATTGQMSGPHTCRRYTINPTTGAKTDSGQDIEVWNDAGSVGGNRWCTALKNEAGMYVFVTERCPT